MVSPAAKNFLWGVAGTVTAAVIVDRMRERRAAKKLELSSPEATVGGPLADVFSATFRPGWYWAALSSAAYSDPAGTPLDTAIKGGFVERATVTSYAGASRVWIKIHVPKAFKGPAAWDLEQWAQWLPSSAAMKPSDVLKLPTPDPLSLQAAEQFDDAMTAAAEAIRERAEKLGDVAKIAASSIADAVVKPMRIGLVVLLGAAALGVFLRARGKS
jgi:hypothetical protein